MRIIFIPKCDSDFSTIERQLKSFGRNDIYVFKKNDYRQESGDIVEIDVFPDKKNALLLDFGRNIDRHGPIDKIRGKNVSESSGNGEAPLKQCPSCFEPVHAAIRCCPECGYEFPPNELDITVRASTAAVLSTQIVPIEYKVLSVTYKRNIGKDGKTDSMMVTYNTLSGQICEWIFFNHPAGSIPHKNAIKWAEIRGFVPSRLDDALTYNWPKPAIVEAIKDGKYFKIKKVVFDVDTSI